MFAVNIISHKAFENATITVIMLNSLTLALEVPGDEVSWQMVIIDDVFLTLYTIEMCMKILGMGFVFGKGAYLQDFWGILDFTIVSSAYVTKAQEWTASNQVQEFGEDGEAVSSGADLSALRSFRVLRPLRTITTIRGLKLLVVSVLSALPMMKQTIIVLFFFFLIFAIAGVQLLSGTLKNRCINEITGKISDLEDLPLCGGRQTCPDGYFCGK
jgi:hypothetical protein